MTSRVEKVIKLEEVDRIPIALVLTVMSRDITKFDELLKEFDGKSEIDGFLLHPKVFYTRLHLCSMQGRTARGCTSHER